MRMWYSCYKRWNILTGSTSYKHFSFKAWNEKEAEAKASKHIRTLQEKSEGKYQYSLIYTRDY